MIPSHNTSITALPLGCPLRAASMFPAQEVIKLINSNDTHRICDVRIARHRMPARLELEELAVHASHSGLSARAAHLKWHWLWTQRQVRAAASSAVGCKSRADGVAASDTRAVAGVGN